MVVWVQDAGYRVWGNARGQFVDMCWSFSLALSPPLSLSLALSLSHTLSLTLQSEEAFIEDVFRHTYRKQLAQVNESSPIMSKDPRIRHHIVDYNPLCKSQLAQRKLTFRSIFIQVWARYPRISGATNGSQSAWIRASGTHQPPQPP